MCALGCACVRLQVCTRLRCTWRSEGNFPELVLSFHLVGESVLLLLLCPTRSFRTLPHLCPYPLAGVLGFHVWVLHYFQRFNSHHWAPASLFTHGAVFHGSTFPPISSFSPWNDRSMKTGTILFRLYQETKNSLATWQTINSHAIIPRCLGNSKHSTGC